MALERTRSHEPRAGLRFELPGACALFTTRAEGNLSTMRGAGHEQGGRRRDRLCGELGLNWLCASRQVHGARVQRVRNEAGTGGQAVAIDADGHATGLRGVGAMVLVADCLPVVLVAPGAVAALHAGWRGLAAGVLEEGVRALEELGGAREARASGKTGAAGAVRVARQAGAAGEIRALIGPGAGPCCYEVGEEVHAAFGGAGRVGARNIDLPAIAHERLHAAGVQRVERSGICTICDERLYSHRREGERAGRQAGVVWLS